MPRSSTLPLSSLPSSALSLRSGSIRRDGVFEPCMHHPDVTVQIAYLPRGTLRSDGHKQNSPNAFAMGLFVLTRLPRRVSLKAR
jgi:hypothetical protein